jgi:hypothetical protein
VKGTIDPDEIVEESQQATSPENDPVVHRALIWLTRRYW